MHDGTLMLCVQLSERLARSCMSCQARERERLDRRSETLVDLDDSETSALDVFALRGVTLVRGAQTNRFVAHSVFDVLGGDRRASSAESVAARVVPIFLAVAARCRVDAHLRFARPADEHALTSEQTLTLRVATARDVRLVHASEERTVDERLVDRVQVRHEAAEVQLTDQQTRL